MINIEIDGQKTQSKPGSTIIEAADAMGIYIPRFCYHKKLSVAANCRMCLVQVGEGKKPMPACATPIAEGMKVSTRSEVAIAAQKAVLEFLLINHPLDCPICDQGGQCELQDLTLGYGPSDSRYTEKKRVVKDLDIGSLVQTHMTRCIQCTRCVRFGQQIAGLPELGVLGRGEKEEIGSYVSAALTSEVSGNIVDICPVGALTAKPSRYTFRPWEVQQLPTLSPHDGVGSHLHAHVHSLQNKVMRVVPREQESLNEVWISDRDRFSYQGLYSPERIGKPLIKQNGEWRETDWITALEYATEKLLTVLNSAGPDQVAGLISPNSTLEEAYLFQKLLRGMGSPHVDHRLQQTDFRDEASWPLQPQCATSFSGIESLQFILFIGVDIQTDLPVLGIRFRKAVKNGAKLWSIHSGGWQQNLPFDQIFVVSNKAAKLHELNPILVDALSQGTSAIFLGMGVWRDSTASDIHAMAAELAQKTGAALNYLLPGANSVGAWLMGCVPHRGIGGAALSATGLDWQASFEQPRQAYILANVEPEWDSLRPGLALQALSSAQCVIALNAFQSPALLHYADVILPTALFAENQGTYLNLQGDWQTFSPVTRSWQESRPLWKILRVLANSLKVPGFEYDQHTQVTSALKEALSQTMPGAITPFTVNAVQSEKATTLKILPYVPAYRTDALVRRAPALQATPRNQSAVVLNPQTARQLGLDKSQLVEVKQADTSFQLPCLISDAISEGCLFIPIGIAETEQFDPTLQLTEISHVA